MSKSSFTWCHCLPVYFPPWHWTKASSFEDNADAVASADDGRGQRGPDEPALEDGRAVRGRAAALPHQGGAVAVGDRQVVAVAVEVTEYRVKVDVKGKKFYWQDHSLLHLYQLGFLQLIRIVIRVVGRGDSTWNMVSKEKQSILRQPTFGATVISRAEFKLQSSNGQVGRQGDTS